MDLIINSSLSEINKAHQFFVEEANKAFIDESKIQRMSVVIDEILSNIIRHGHGENSKATILFTCLIHEDTLTMIFKDSGKAFNPLLAESPNFSSNLDALNLGGLGIHLIKNLVDSIKYERQGNFNVLELNKYVK